MKPTVFLFGIATCTLVVSTLNAAAPRHQASAQQAQAAADDPAAGLFAETCGKCHDAARIVAMRRTSAEWEDVIKKMIEKGAPGTEKDFETVYDYLLRHIVAYRKSHGPFADVGALKKVPDNDVKKLDEHKDAVAF